MHNVSSFFTSAMYIEATGGPTPNPIPTKNLPRSIPVNVLVVALEMHVLVSATYQPCASSIDQLKQGLKFTIVKHQ